jgi:hypothetical protein
VSPLAGSVKFGALSPISIIWHSLGFAHLGFILQEHRQESDS